MVATVQDAERAITANETSPRPEKRRRMYSCSPLKIGFITPSPTAPQNVTRNAHAQQLSDIPCVQSDLDELRAVVKNGTKADATDFEKKCLARTSAAFRAVSLLHVFKYESYKLAVNLDKENGRLSPVDFQQVLRVSFAVTQCLLERALKAGFDAALARRRLASAELRTTETTLKRRKRHERKLLGLAKTSRQWTRQRRFK